MLQNNVCYKKELHLLSIRANKSSPDNKKSDMLIESWPIRRRIFDAKA